MSNIEEKLCKLISFKTDDNKNEIAKIVSYIANIFDRHNVVYEVIKNNDGRENIVALVGGKSFRNLDDAILLSGHLDVVGAIDEMFEPKVQNGKVFGRGAVDMKGFIAVVLSSIDELKQLNRPIVLAFSSDEETSVNGVKSILKFFDENKIKFVGGIVGEPTNFKIGLANRGYLCARFNIKGKAVHSSVNKNGINAVEIMAKLWQKIFELNDSFYDNGATLNVGKIKCNNEVNVVADRGDFLFEIRYDDEGKKDIILQSILRQREKLEDEYKGLEIKYEKMLEILSFKNDGKGDFAKKIIEKTNGDIRNLPYATEAGFYQNYGIDVVLFGAGLDELCHTKNEAILLSDLDKYKDVLLKILTD